MWYLNDWAVHLLSVFGHAELHTTFTTESTYQISDLVASYKLKMDEKKTGITVEVPDSLEASYYPPHL